MKNHDAASHANKTQLLGTVHQERGDFLLPQIVDYMESKKWIDPRPPYQRRQVWDDIQKSRFLESLVLNLPVPPLFLYEKSYGEWEIMDGQQRSNAIVEFYQNKLTLRGLKTWTELNKNTYKTCPEYVRRNFDRRRIQVTTVLAETSDLPNLDVRKEVFERLNTGGRPLRAQEIRNCLYSGEFCDLLDDMSSLPAFTTLWQIPPHLPPRQMRKFNKDLLDNKRFARMEDCEMVLRYFAFSKSTFFSGAVKSALDKCMEYYYKNADPDILNKLSSEFKEAIELVLEVFGEKAILVPNKREKHTPTKQLFDALMHSANKYSRYSSEMIRKRKAIQAKLDIFMKDDRRREKIITRYDSKNAFQSRCKVISQMIDQVLKS